MSDTMKLSEWAATKPERFDLSVAYTEQVEPLVDQLSALCQKLGMPFVFVVQEGTDHDGCIYNEQTAIISTARVGPGILSARAAAKGELRAVMSIARANDERVDL